MGKIGLLFIPTSYKDVNCKSRFVTDLKIPHIMTLEQCDQIGRFLKVLCNIFFIKVAKIFGNFMVYFEVSQFLRKDR